jgi:hypothetical protein
MTPYRVLVPIDVNTGRIPLLGLDCKLFAFREVYSMKWGFVIESRHIN